MASSLELFVDLIHTKPHLLSASSGDLCLFHRCAIPLVNVIPTPMMCTWRRRSQQMGLGFIKEGLLLSGSPN